MDRKELVEKGNKYRLEGDKEKALHAYQKVVDFYLAKTDGLSEEDSRIYADALNGEGIIIYDEEVYEYAWKIFRNALDVKPQYARTLYNIGTTYDKLQRYTQALDAYKSAISIDPHNPKIWYNMGNTFCRLQRYQDAIKAFDRALEESPDFIKKVYHNKGMALFELKKYKDALKSLDKAIKEDPKYIKALYNKGVTLYKLQKYQDALEMFERIIEKEPDNIKIWNSKGITLERLNLDELAIKAFEEAAKRKKDDLSPYTCLGELYLDHGDLFSSKNALETVRKIMENEMKNKSKEEMEDEIKKKISSSLILEGKIKIEEKQYDGAMDCFREAMHLDLDNVKPILFYAYARYLKAECTFDPEIKEYKSEIFATIRELERALDLCEKFNHKKLKACVLYFLGNLYYRSKDILAAKDRLEKCINLKSGATIDEKAHDLLKNIWNNVMRPRWWEWWLDSPLHRWEKRAAFLIIVFCLVFLFVLQAPFSQLIPFIELTISDGPKWYPVLIAIGLLIFLILSPSIESIGAGEIDIKMRSQVTPLEVFLSPSIMKEEIEENWELTG